MRGRSWRKLLGLYTVIRVQVFRAMICLPFNTLAHLANDVITAATIQLKWHKQCPKFYDGVTEPR